MTDAVAADQTAEEAVLGAAILAGDSRVVAGLIARGLRPEHFYNSAYRNVFTAMTSIADRYGAVDHITVAAELDRLGLRDSVPRAGIEYLAGCVPAAGNHGAYADRVMELARWRQREDASRRLHVAVAQRDEGAWLRASNDLDVAVGGTRTESYSPEQWASLLFDDLAHTQEQASREAVPLPFPRMSQALGGGLRPGEWMALSGPTSHGKSLLVDQWLDTAAKHGKRCHLYMTEMTAITRGQRLLARRTGVPFMRQRRKELDDAQRQKLLAELQRLNFGCTVAADWSAEDVVRDALRARYDFVVVDLLHGFHYEDERALDRLSKAVQRLARVSTTLDGHPGTAVVAVTHLKEEGLVRGKVPRPGISSIKGGSSIKQDADFVGFVWQDQAEDGALNGEAEFWIAKGRSGGLEKELLRLVPSRFQFTLREREGDTPAAQGSAF